VHAAFAGFGVVRVAGWVLVAVGLVFLMETFARFALEGLGTPAPVMPTRHLVVTASYRFVRNPMYFAVLALILGQALAFGDLGIEVYGLCVWVGFATFVVLLRSRRCGGYSAKSMRRFARRCRGGFQD